MKVNDSAVSFCGCMAPRSVVCMGSSVVLFHLLLSYVNETNLEGFPCKSGIIVTCMK